MEQGERVMAGVESVTVQRANPGTKRILAVSDIHGNLKLFQELLQKMEYKAGADTLVVVGDLLEKGPENLATLRFAMSLAKNDNVFIVCGNCDRAYEYGDLSSVLRKWEWHCLYCEMAQLEKIALPEMDEEAPAFLFALERAYPAEFSFIKSFPDILETPRFLFAHAGLQGENLEGQKRKYVRSQPLFAAEQGPRFSRLMVVGHYPAANFCKEKLDNAPYFNTERNVLCIDGGNVVRGVGQLNGVILDSEAGTWCTAAVDSFRKCPSPWNQQEKRGNIVRWSDEGTEVLEEGAEFSLCVCGEARRRMEVPNEFLYRRDGVLYCADMTDYRPAVQAGEEISVVREYSDRWLIMKDGVMGFLDRKK